MFESGTHGYDTTDHFRIDRRLGDDGDFDALAKAVHARGLRLLLDGVFNHVGRGFPHTEWLRREGPEYATFEGHDGLVALDHDEPAVADHVVRVMRHWLDRGADGWRLDAAFAGNHDVTRLASRLTDARLIEHALVVLFTVGGTPSVYYGDEQAYRGIKEEREGGDDAIRPAFPAAGPSGLRAEGRPAYRLHQRLIGLRRRHSWLHAARTEVLELGNRHLAYRVADGNDRLVVGLNLGAEPVSLPSATTVLDDTGTVEHDRVELPPYGWAITGS